MNLLGLGEPSLTAVSLNPTCEADKSFSALNWLDGVSDLPATRLVQLKVSESKAQSWPGKTQKPFCKDVQADFIIS